MSCIRKCLRSILRILNKCIWMNFSDLDEYRWLCKHLYPNDWWMEQTRTSQNICFTWNVISDLCFILHKAFSLCIPSSAQRAYVMNFTQKFSFINKLFVCFSLSVFFFVCLVMSSAKRKSIMSSKHLNTFILVTFWFFVDHTIY